MATTFNSSPYDKNTTNPFAEDYHEDSSVFYKALPHGVANIALTGIGAITLLTGVGGSSTAALVASVALAILGAYGIIATIYTAMESKTPQEFSQKIWKSYTTFLGMAIADIGQFIAKVVLTEVLHASFNRGERRNS